MTMVCKFRLERVKHINVGLMQANITDGGDEYNIIVYGRYLVIKKK